MPLSALPLFHRVAGQRVVLVGDGPAADAKRRLIERAGATPCPETEAHHARLAFVALSDPRAAEAAALRLRRQGLLVNVTDRPELCDFTTPSVLERDPLLIAVGTGGASAGLAKHVRLRLEAFLPPSLGTLASALHNARDRVRARWPEPSDRRRALDEALAQGGPLDPLAEGSAEQVEEWIHSGSVESSPRVEEIVLTSDDPDDLTLRQARLLGEAEAVVHNGEVPQAILSRARADAMLVSAPELAPSSARLTIILRGSTL